MGRLNDSFGQMKQKQKMHLSWSFFHYTLHDINYFKKILNQADRYNVRNFEICTEIPKHGFDMYILYKDFRKVQKYINMDYNRKMQDVLNSIVDLSHKSGRKVTMWHREVVLPAKFAQVYPYIFDEKGEIDYNKPDYFKLVRSKINEFFEYVPGIDGIVLTLTEADYSVINNSDADRYPPVETAQKIITTFAKELKERGKSFTLRTFGSIDRDYKILTQAAEKVLKEYSFELETKVTPFDWSLVLSNNPYLKRIGNSYLAAEFDTVGEFFGLGEIPCMIPDLELKWLKYAKEKNCSRICTRIDRNGRQCFDSLNMINLYSIIRGVKDEKVTSDIIWKEWLKDNFHESADEVLPIFRKSKDIILKTYYIDGHMISQDYVPTIEMMMLGSITSLFKENISLDFTDGLWSVLSHKTTPTRGFIIKEKEEALKLAGECYKKIINIRENIPANIRGLTVKSWKKLVYITSFFLQIINIINAYFKELENNVDKPKNLQKAVKDSINFANKAKLEKFGGLIDEFAETMKKNGEEFFKFYKAELNSKRLVEKIPGLIDFVIIGGLTHEWRIRRYMHGSEPKILDNRPLRIVGNRVFPNGFLEMTLKSVGSKNIHLLVSLHNEGGPAKLIIDDTSEYIVHPDKSNVYSESFIRGINTKCNSIKVRIEKTSLKPPYIALVATINMVE